MRKLRNKLNLHQRQRTAKVLASEPLGLLAPFNRHGRNRRVDKVIDLLRTLQEIQRLEDISRYEEALLGEDPNYNSPEPAPSYLYAQANEILRSYHWSPIVLPESSPRGSFSWPGKTLHSDWENRFVWWLLNLWREGEISRVRNCRTCDSWFYAVTNHQTFCTNLCRQKFQSKTDKFKASRRQYMRDYRRAEKERDLKAIQRASARQR